MSGSSDQERLWLETELEQSEQEDQAALQGAGRPGPDSESADSSLADSPSDKISESEGAERSSGGFTNNLVLLLTGVLLGVYGLYVLGWINLAFTRSLPYGGPAGQVFYRIASILAILSPLLWVLGVYWLTRNLARFWRWLWLFAGVVLLIPWGILR